MSELISPDVIHIPKKMDDTPYNIEYYTFLSEEDPVGIVCKNLKKVAKDIRHQKNTACFMSSRRYCGSNRDKAQNRLLYICKLNHKKEVALTTDEIARWVELCQSEGMLPRINPDYIKTGEVCLDLKKYPSEMVYLQLCCLRDPQEKPYFIKTILCLMDKGVGFFTAIAVASIFCVNNSGHHFLPVCRYTAGMPTLARALEQKFLFDLTYAKRLHLFLHSRQEKAKGIGSCGFGLDSTLRRFKAKDIKVKKDELASAETEARVRSE